MNSTETGPERCPVCQDDPPIRARGGVACPHCGHTQESKIAAEEAEDQNDVCTDCGTPGPHQCPAAEPA